MELEHRFELPVGVDKAFPALLDLDLIGPCFPGATVDSVTGDQFAGTVKVKIGPVQLNYKGTATFVDKDFTNHTVVIEAAGAAPRSGSTATMLVSASAKALAPNRTAVVLVTTLSITGRAASFSRQVMIDVGNELIGSFADCVSNKLAGRSAGGATLLGVVNPDEVAAAVAGGGTGGGGDRASGGGAAAAAPKAPPKKPAAAASAAPTGAPSKPIDLLAIAKGPIADQLRAKAPMLKQYAPVIGGGVIAILLLVTRRRKPDAD